MNILNRMIMIKIKQVFYMFSQNRVDDVIVGFIKEIIQNENLMFGDEVITLAKYDSILSEIVCGAYNVNYPVNDRNRMIYQQYIYVKNYQNLKNSYLFYNNRPETKAYLEAHPGAHLYRMGIGDVSLPLCDAVIQKLHEAVEDQAHKTTFHGYMPECGDTELRTTIAAYYQKEE